MAATADSNELMPVTSRSDARASADIGVFGAEETRAGKFASSSAPYSTRTSYDEPPSGAQTPTPLLVSHDRHTQKNGAIHTGEESYPMESITRTRSHMGDALENLYQTQTARSQVEAGREPTLEAGSPPYKSSRGRPKEFPNLTTEIIFILICSSGQLFFSFFQGNINVNQQAFREALGIESSELPWLVGSYLVALGLSVILSGSLSDLMPPRMVIVSALVWLTIWNIIGAFSLTPARSPLFFFMRAMQGLSVGVIVSGTMSILGRVYAPGIRKTRVFSAMSSMAPFGFFLGAVQGGALTAHLNWVFGSNAILCGLCAIAAYFTIPPLRPVADIAGADAPSIHDFDWKGAIFATSGCVCLLFGLTQGTVADWSPYTYTLIIVGVILLASFFFVEHKVYRPLIPNSLWKTPGLSGLMAAYFLGFGGFASYQFYAMQFFLNIQHVSALTVALYLLPNAILGLAATFAVAKLLHKVPGHYIYIVSMIAFALGPAFFLGNKPSTIYWALSFPSIALATFGPDMSFAAASIFITSNVPRSYQGSAGSLLVTIQNLSSAIMTSVGDSIAAKVDTLPDGTIGLDGLRAAWWFGLASALTGALITAIAVRIPKEVEKEHVT